jgi:type IV secretion system protein VirD4
MVLAVGALLLVAYEALGSEADLMGWCVKAAFGGSLMWGALLLVAGGRQSQASEESGPGDVDDGTSPGEVARAHVARLGGGAYLGAVGGHWVTADPESAVMVLGPPRSGKTSAVMVPAMISASGPVVSTSTKPDVMRASLRARSEVGQAWLFDPAASVGEVPEGVRRLGWSPVAAAGTWDSALVTARAMCAAGRAGAGTKDEGHWAERAAALLAPLIHAAALTDRPIGEVVSWVLRQNLGPAAEVLRDADSEIAVDVLTGIEATDPRERSSIFSATAGVLSAYSSDSVREAAARPNFDPVRFVSSTDTIYVTAPEHRQALCAPLIVGMLEEVRHAVYDRAAVGLGARRMLWALDEVANIAPIHDLPALVSQAGGQGLQVMVGLQDLSQARERWGAEVADGFTTLFQTKLVLAGIGDTRTLEGISMALGEYDRKVVARTSGRSRTDEWLRRTPDQYSESVSHQTQRQRVLSPGEVARLPSNQGLVLRGAEWRLIDLTQWFACEPWRSAAGRSGAAASGV